MTAGFSPDAADAAVQANIAAAGYGRSKGDGGKRRGRRTPCGRRRAGRGVPLDARDHEKTGAIARYSAANAK